MTARPTARKAPTLPGPATTPAAAPHDRTPVARLEEGALHAIVGYQVAQAAIVTDTIFAAEVGKADSLRPVEYTLLALVAANPDVTARQLARGLAVAPPNVAVYLERLQARGLLMRRRSKEDARVQHLRATAAGQALARQATQRLLAAEAQALAGALSPAEQAMLVELLHKLALARRRAAAR